MRDEFFNEKQVFYNKVEKNKLNQYSLFNKNKQQDYAKGSPKFMQRIASESQLAKPSGLCSSIYNQKMMSETQRFLHGSTIIRPNISMKCTQPDECKLSLPKNQSGASQVADKVKLPGKSQNQTSLIKSSSMDTTLQLNSTSQLNSQISSILPSVKNEMVTDTSRINTDDITLQSSNKKLKEKTEEKNSKSMKKHTSDDSDSDNSRKNKFKFNKSKQHNLYKRNLFEFDRYSVSSQLEQVYQKNGMKPPGPRIKSHTRQIRMIDSKTSRHVPAIEMQELWSWRAFRNIVQTEKIKKEAIASNLADHARFNEDRVTPAQDAFHGLDQGPESANQAHSQRQKNQGSQSYLQRVQQKQDENGQKQQVLYQQEPSQKGKKKKYLFEKYRDLLNKVQITAKPDNLPVATNPSHRSKSMQSASNQNSVLNMPQPTISYNPNDISTSFINITTNPEPSRLLDDDNSASITERQDSLDISDLHVSKELSSALERTSTFLSKKRRTIIHPKVNASVNPQKNFGVAVRKSMDNIYVKQLGQKLIEKIKILQTQIEMKDKQSRGAETDLSDEHQFSQEVEIKQTERLQKALAMRMTLDQDKSGEVLEKELQKIQRTKNMMN